MRSLMEMIRNPFPLLGTNFRTAPIKRDGTRLEEDALVAALDTGKCPDCGGINLLGGPCGGLAQNVLCANPACLHEFCYAERFFAKRTVRSVEDRKAIYGV
jgi:hypothetical protein